MKHKKFLRVFTCVLTVMLLAVLFAAPAMAAATAPTAGGNVASVVEKTWVGIESQAKDIVNKVIFPALDLILGVAFIISVVTQGINYKKHGQIEWTHPVLLFVCLIISLTAPLYIWDII